MKHLLCGAGGQPAGAGPAAVCVAEPADRGAVCSARVALREHGTHHGAAPGGRHVTAGAVAAGRGLGIPLHAPVADQPGMLSPVAPHMW